MSKNCYTDVTKPNQRELSKRAKAYLSVNKLDGAEFLQDGMIPIGMMLFLPKDGKGNAAIISPSKVYKSVCPKCRGTGVFVWGPGGKFRGKCTDCSGKGFLTGADLARDSRYHSIRTSREEQENPQSTNA